MRFTRGSAASTLAGSLAAGILAVTGLVAAGCSGGGSGGGGGALAVSAKGPTNIFGEGGAGELDGGTGADVDFFADEITVGLKKVKCPKTPKTKSAKSGDLEIGGQDWDAVSSILDLDPDPDTIRTHGNIIVTGTLTVDFDENLECGEGSIFVDGAIVKTDDVGEDDGVLGPIDDDDDESFEITAEDGIVVVRGTINGSGDDDGVSFTIDGGALFIKGQQVFVDEAAQILAFGGNAGVGGGDGGDGGFVFLNAANDAFSDSGKAVGKKKKYTVKVAGLIDVSGGSSADEDGGGGGLIDARTFEPGKKTLTVLVGTHAADGGNAEDQGGNGGDINADGSDVGLGGSFFLAGGTSELGEGGAGGDLRVGDDFKASRLCVAGGREAADEVDLFLSGGSADATVGQGGRGGRYFLLAIARNCSNDANVLARGGSAADGGDGGLTFFEAHHGDLENSGDIDVSGANGLNGSGGFAGGAGGTDPDELDFLNFHVNDIGIVMIAVDGDLTNSGALTALGGNGGGTGGSGGAGADVILMIDDNSFQDEAGDPDGTDSPAGVAGVEGTDGNGGTLLNTGAILTSGGDAAVAGFGGDAGDVSLDRRQVDDDNDNNSRNEGAITGVGGDAAGANAQGGDGGDVLFGDVVNESTVSQEEGADAGLGDPEPSLDGVTTTTTN